MERETRSTGTMAPGGAGQSRSVYRANGAADAWKTVDFDVFGQVVTAGKLLLTHLALVRLDTRVGPPMSGQLVRPGEPGKRTRRQMSVT